MSIADPVRQEALRQALTLTDYARDFEPVSASAVVDAAAKFEDYLRNGKNKEKEAA